MNSIDPFGGFLISRKKSTEKIPALNWYLTEQDITGGFGFLDVKKIAHYSDSWDGMKSHLAKNPPIFFWAKSWVTNF